MPLTRLPAFLCLALATCVAVPSPEAVNVEVVVKGVPAGAQSVLVELTETSTGSILDRHPVPSTADLHVFYANVPAGPIQILAQALDDRQHVVASAEPISSTATAARKTFVAALHEGPPPCVEFDRDGFACPQHFANLPFTPARIVPLGPASRPTVLLVSADPSSTALLVTGDGAPTSVAAGVPTSGVVLSADRNSALVPGSPSADASPTYALALVRVNETPPVATLDVRVRPGDYGLLADGTAWAIDAARSDGRGTLVLVPPDRMAPVDLGNHGDDADAGTIDDGDAGSGEGDVDAGATDDNDGGATDDGDGGATDDVDAGLPPGPPAPPCSGLVRGPVGRAFDGSALVFESDVSRLVRVGPGAACAAATLPDDFVGQPGAFSATPDLAVAATAGPPPDRATVRGFVRTFKAGAQDIVETALTVDSESDFSVDGATATASDGTVFVSTTGGLLTVDSTGAVSVATNQFHAVTQFDLREPPGGAAIAYATNADGFVAMKAAGQGRFVVAPAALDWSTRLVGPDGSMVVWEKPAPSLHPAAWFFDAAHGAAPVRLQTSTPGDARVWHRASGDVYVYATDGALFVAPDSIRPLVSARVGLSWDVGDSGLVYIQPVGASAPYRLAAPTGATPTPLASTGASAVAVSPGETGRFWVAFTNGELARIGLPEGATP